MRSGSDAPLPIDKEPLMKLRQFVSSALLAAQLVALGLPAPAAAHPQPGLSEASALSALPVAVSIAAPVMVLSTGVALTVVAVEVSAAGTVWVLERASDGARIVVRFAGRVAEGASVAVGTAVVVTVLSAGYVLSAAGQAIAFIPNAIGASLLYNERITY